MVSAKITKVYQGWEPCVNQNPWDMLEKLTKEEFLRKGRAKESAMATTTKAMTKTSGLWRMTRSPFLGTTKTKATGRSMLPANTIRTIRTKMIRMKIRIRTMRRRFLLGSVGVSYEALDPSRRSKSNPTPTTSLSVRLSITSFPIPRSPSDVLYPSRSSRSNRI